MNDNTEDEIRVDYGIGLNMRNSKLITTASMKAKLNKVMQKAIDNITNAVDSEDSKLAYKASLDVIAIFQSLAVLDMKEENHREQMKFSRFKNRQNKRTEEKQKIEEDIAKGGGTTHIPQSEFSDEFDVWS